MNLIALSLRLRWLQLPAGILILLLQRTPLLRVLVQGEARLVGNAAAILRSAFAVTAMGAYNSVAGATQWNVVASPNAASPTSGATNETFRISATINTAATVEFTESGAPAILKSWRVTGTLPTGLSVVGGNPVNVSAPYKMTVSGTPTIAGTYPVTVTGYNQDNATGLSGAIQVIFTITGGAAVAPTFTTQPRNVTVTAGGPATFSVVVATTANPTPTLQWTKNGANISGATTATYAIAATVEGDAGSYAAVATSTAGTATSTAAILTVNPALAAPSITTQPLSQTVTAGNSVTFSSAASGNPTPTYQWQKGGVNISGATSATYTIASTAAGDAGNYAVVATSTSGSVTSATATLTVSAALAAPSITTQPLSQTVTAGTSVTFTAAASGNPTPTYQWRKDGIIIAGATNVAFVIPSSVIADAGIYTVTASNSAGTATSAAATLTVNAATSADALPYITKGPTSQSVTAGETATFAVEVEGTAPFTYQWYVSDIPISGATASSLSIVNANASDGSASYTVKVSNTAGSVMSYPDYAANITEVKTSGRSALFIKNDGTLSAAGNNEFYQLGDGTTTTYKYVSQIGAGVKSVSAGPTHSFYIKSDGTLWGMGDNSRGQLGDGTTSTRTTPVQVASGVRAVATAYYRTMFIKTDNTLWGMGFNSYGELGDGTTTTRTTPVQVASGVLAVATAYNGAMFIKSDGTLWGMGNNSGGQLGDGTTTTRTTPVQVASGVRAVATGGYHSTFIKSDGTLWATGINAYGSFGNGTKTNSTSPVQVATEVSAVAACEYRTLYIKNDATLWGTGYNEQGQLGDGTTTTRTTPVQVASGVRAVATGGDLTFFIKTDGTLWGSGFAGSDFTLGNGNTSYELKPIQILSGRKIAKAILTVNYLPSPRVLVSPSGKISANSSVSLRTAETGNSPCTYQWKKDGSIISGAILPNLTIPAFGVADMGDYSVSVTNIAGTVTSAAVPLTLSIPTITSQTAISGKSASFSVATVIAGTIRWQLSTDNGNTWAALTDGSVYSGSTTNLLDIKSVSASVNNYKYRYQVTSGTQIFTSDATTLNVILSPFLMPNGIKVDSSNMLYVTDAAAQVVGKIGSDFKFISIAGGKLLMGSVDAIGVSARFNEPSGIYRKEDGNILVADTTNSVIRNISAAGDVTTFAGSSGNLGSTDGNGVAARFNMPADIARDVSGNYVITDTANHIIRLMSASGIVATLSGKTAGFAGSVDGVSTIASFNLPTGIAVRTDSGVSVTANGVTTGLGTIFISDYGSHIIRVVSAAGQVGTYLGTANLSGTANGATIAARFKNPSGLVVDSLGNLYVADTGNHTIRKATTAGVVTTFAGKPTVNGLMDGLGGSALFNAPEGLAVDSSNNLYVADTGNAAIRKITPAGVVTTLPIVGEIPTITTQPTSQTVTAGNSASFSVVATGYGTLTYQWKKDGSDIAGAAAATYTISSSATTAAGSYTVVVTNAAGSVTSAAATLTVNVLPAITTQPSSQSVTAGSSVTFSVVATGTPTPTYQWRKDGAAISGATATSYAISSPVSGDAGSYTAVVTNAAGSVTSSSATLTVNAAYVPPPASSGGGGGGGGAPSYGFLALLALWVWRRRQSSVA